MLASKIITASVLFITTALSANAVGAGEYPLCERSFFGPGKDNVMQPDRSTTNTAFQLAGFRIQKVRPGVYDFHGGPTKANKATMRVNIFGATDPERTYRFAFNTGYRCTAMIPDPSLGQGMGAWVETY